MSEVKHDYKAALDAVSKHTKFTGGVDGHLDFIKVFLDEENLDAIIHALKFAESNQSLLSALKAAVDCGMVPVTSFSEGGAAKYSIQIRVADQIREAIAQAEKEIEECTEV